MSPINPTSSSKEETLVNQECICDFENWNQSNKFAMNQMKYLIFKM